MGQGIQTPFCKQGEDNLSIAQATSEANAKRSRDGVQAFEGRLQFRTFTGNSVSPHGLFACAHLMFWDQPNVGI